MPANPRLLAAAGRADSGLGLGGALSPVALAEQVGMTLATWDEEIAPAMTFKNMLIYRDGAVVLQTRYHDGSTSAYEVAERPADSPNERRFDLEPDSDRSEYITLTDAGVVKYFDWAGQQFRVAFTTRIHADFLTLGAQSGVGGPACRRNSHQHRSRSWRCTNSCCPSRTIKNLWPQDLAGPIARGWKPPKGCMTRRLPPSHWDQLGFLAGDVMMLGMDYASAGGGRLSRGAQDLAETIQAGIALATCHAATP